MSDNTKFVGGLAIPKQQDKLLRMLPTTAAQSALFTVGGNAPRKELKKAVLAAGGGSTIVFSGTELRSDDLDVFMGVLYMARGMNITPGTKEAPVQFIASHMLELLEKPTSSYYYNWLDESLDRLQRASIRITDKDGGILQGNLIRMIQGKTPEQRQWRVFLEYDVIEWLSVLPLRVNWAQRKRLRRPLSKWLHTFMNSFQKSMPDVCCAPERELWKLCGSDTKTLQSFRSALLVALEQMEEQKVIFGHLIRDGVVYIALKENAVIFEAASAATSQFQLAFAEGF